MCFFLPEPNTTIMGAPEMYISRGSTINLTCIVEHSPEPPSNIQWTHNNQVSTSIKSYKNLTQYFSSLVFIYWPYESKNIEMYIYSILIRLCWRTLNWWESERKKFWISFLLNLLPGNKLRLTSRRCECDHWEGWCYRQLFADSESKTVWFGHL